jgi:PHD/YefM family antitoxin component YafN of YafNO toxin-antitoxin module
MADIAVQGCTAAHHLRELLMTVAVRALPTSEAALGQLQRKPVSDVKREGWRGIKRSVEAAGTLLMTSHDKPEAVILSLAEYRQLTEMASAAQREQQDKLERLSRAFDAELALLQQPGAGKRLRAAFGAPLALKGKVVAGHGF